MTILFTICGRAGSKGFKNKNVKEMNGVPLVYYTLAAIKGYAGRHGEDDIRVAVNTDSKELKDIIKAQKAVCGIEYVRRKEELAGDAVPKIDVIRDTYLAVKGNRAVDVAVDLDITSPLRTVGDVEHAIRELLVNPEYDLVYSVVEARRSPYFNLVEQSADGFFHTVCEGNLTARQQAPKCYELNASIYAYRPEFLEGNIDKAISAYRTGISLMRDYLALDIDSEEDFVMMEMLHRYYIDTQEDMKALYADAKCMRDRDSQTGNDKERRG